MIFICERHVIFDETLYFQGETLDDTDLSVLEPRDSVQEPTTLPTTSDSAPGGHNINIDVHGAEPDSVDSVGPDDSDVELPITTSSNSAIPSATSPPRSTPHQVLQRLLQITVYTAKVFHLPRRHTSHHSRP